MSTTATILRNPTRAYSLPPGETYPQQSFALLGLLANAESGRCSRSVTLLAGKSSALATRTFGDGSQVPLFRRRTSLSRKQIKESWGFLHNVPPTGTHRDSVTAQVLKTSVALPIER